MSEFPCLAINLKFVVMRKGPVILFVVVISMVFTACFYPEGPVISLAPKKQRLVNKWKFKKVTLNNLDITDRHGNLFIDLKADQDVVKQFIYPDSSLDSVVEHNGRWEFDMQSKLVLNLFLVDSTTLETSAEKWLILKLKEDELWLQFRTLTDIVSYELVPYE